MLDRRGSEVNSTKVLVSDTISRASQWDGLTDFRKEAYWWFMITPKTALLVLWLLRALKSANCRGV